MYSFNKEKILTQLKEQGYEDPESTIDWESYSLDEPIEDYLFREYQIQLTSLRKQVDEIKAIKEKEKIEGQKRLKKEEAELLAEWSKSEPESINIKSFEIPQDYIKMCCRKISNGCFLTGSGGIGKSYTTINTIKEEKREFVYLNTAITPLALYKYLYNHKNALIVIDDIEGVFQDMKSIAILKNALWEIDKKRLIFWETTSNRLDGIPECFEFEGQIIILANKLNLNNQNISALVSRVNYKEIQFTFQEKITIMKSIIKKPYKELLLKDRQYVLKKIIDNTDEANINFNFRTLIKAYNFYIYNKDKFEMLLNSILEKDEYVVLIKKLSERDLSVDEQINLYIRTTNKSRRHYFLKKKQICKSAIDLEVEVNL